MKVIQLSIRFIALMLLQIFLFSNIQVFHYGMIFIYIYFILFLPLTLKPWQVLLISFITGFIIDITTGTYGLHMAAATFIGFIKNGTLRFIVGKDFEDDVTIFNLSKLTLSQTISYIFLLTLVFCLVFFALDYFSISALKKFLLQISASAVTTFVSLFIYKLLFTRNT